MSCPSLQLSIRRGSFAVYRPFTDIPEPNSWKVSPTGWRQVSPRYAPLKESCSSPTIPLSTAYAEKADQEKSQDAMKFNCAQRMLATIFHHSYFLTFFYSR